MTTNAKIRVRKRIRARLDELGMTGREVARALGKSDAWISGILNDAQALSLDDLDDVAEALRLSPSELVRYDDSDLRELRPHEMRLLRHYQQWPEQIQERWLRVLDYFAVMTPDPESARLLDLWRDLPLPDRRRLRVLLQQQLADKLPRTDAPVPDRPGSTGGSAEPSTTRPARADERGSATPTPSDDDPDSPDGR